LALNGHPVSYALRRARRRSIGFSVGVDGLKVSAPRWVPLYEVERALHSKADWILRKLVEQRERAQRLEANRIVWAEGCSLPYLGQPLRLALVPSLKGQAVHVPATADGGGAQLQLALPAGATAEQIRDAAQAWLQRQARALFAERAAHFAARLGVRYTRLSLSSAQTRWGSASASGAIRLNWRLMHFAPAVIDYVVAHELAHLREMNHSERFWAVVRSVLPDYEQAQRHLREQALAGMAEP
jgi:predicted metal-dependent hydrolase